MLVHVLIDTPIRTDLSYDELWKDEDRGLILSWENGRKARERDVDLVRRVCAGELPVLVWKGGVDPENPPKTRKKIGILYYLAWWQGVRGEDLKIDTEAEPQLVCTRTGVTVTYTFDYAKYCGTPQSEKAEA
ncbi:MAG TPA: hypothetical protein VFF03_07590 [Rhodocyclaceae bacterium]|nr:hypothetical protein [Rhodocyclaceae bacterium]